MSAQIAVEETPQIRVPPTHEHRAQNQLQNFDHLNINRPSFQLEMQ